ncbi:lysylphosphatidylglycerol synthase transmembrane domain-containing protein [Halomonas sabkhae]|nr:lysylphosphatidylglycerol synthase transmembrane domain-containing protein [Halomonas sabkhae]MDN3524817.1 lysylphosphatidylglycerol synthase transmembrane domain-containing protein [Halomonas sabkhae]
MVSRRRHVWLMARWALALSAVALVCYLVGGSRVAARFSELQVGWVIAGLLVSVPQVAMSAWRWWYTQRCLGLSMAPWQAFQEYYLATFLNQVLPGGVAGDVSRAWRHARQTGEAWRDRRRQQALRAVVIERVSGQLALALLVALSLALLPIWQPLRHQLGRFMADQGASLVVLPLALIGSGALVAWGVSQVRRRTMPAVLAGGWQDVRHSLLMPRRLGLHLLVSLATVFSYALVMLCAARAIGIETSAATLLALAPLLLLAMVMPLSLAGWGWREGAAALVWPLIGLSAADGVAVSLAYGLLVLVSSLPGVLVLLAALLAPRAGGVGHQGASGGSQVKVEEGVTAQRETPTRRTPRTLQGLDGSQAEPGLAGADQQGGDEQMQAIEDAGLEEVRQGSTPALDEDAAIAGLAQVRDDRPGQAAAAHVGQDRMPFVDAAGHASLRGQRGADQLPGRRLAIGKQAMVAGEPPSGVDDHAQRVGALDMAHRQRRIIGGDGAGTDDHGIDQGAQPMQMGPRFEAIDVMRVPAGRGDAAIQALPQLADDTAFRGAEHRQQGIEQLGVGAVQRRLGLPAAVGLDRQPSRVEGNAQRHR